MGVKVAIGEMLPCTSMIIIEACTIFLTIMASTAMSKLGMSPFVFVVYTNALSFILLIPFSILFHRNNKTEEPLFTFPLVLRAFFLSLVGVTIAQNLAFAGLSYSSPIVACGAANMIPAFSFIIAIILRVTIAQNLAFAGLSYSSPIVACGAANMIPAFSFIIAIILRKIRIDLKRQESIVRVIGTLISIMGILAMTFYKGPVVKQYSPSFLHHASPHLFIFTSTHENWVLGCFLFASASFALVIWNIIQIGTSKKHPHVMKITCLYTLFGTIQSALLALLMEKDLSVWRLKLDMELLVIVLTAIFGSLIRSNVQIWCSGLKGPSYILFFKPVGVPVARTCGCVLFGATFHYGSISSACICGLGYYTTLWGQLKEDETMKNKKGNVTTSDERVPLLEEQQEEDSQV